MSDSCFLHYRRLKDVLNCTLDLFDLFGLVNCEPSHAMGDHYSLSCHQDSNLCSNQH